MIRIYILVVVIGIVGAAAAGAYYYYTDSQARIQALIENTAKLKMVKSSKMTQLIP